MGGGQEVPTWGISGLQWCSRSPENQWLVHCLTDCSIPHTFQASTLQLFHSHWEISSFYYKMRAIDNWSLSIKHFFLFWEIPNLLQNVWLENIFLTSVCLLSLDLSPFGAWSVGQGGKPLVKIIILILNIRITHQNQSTTPNFKRNNHQYTPVCYNSWVFLATR